MHELINKLAFSLFKKNSMEECSVQEIEHLAKQYPYFSSAQILLAAKQKQTNDQGFEKHLTTASLHVNNPLWLNYLLASKPAVEKKIVAEEKNQEIEVIEEPNNDELVLEKTHHGFIVTSKREERSSDVSQASLPPDAEKAAPDEQPLAFEPYYTVDYFASQGIKNVIEDKPTDRFSQQLKSFTEWLKTIRQIPPQQIAAMTDGGSEEKVVQLATHSLEEKSVETEAMAEVWIKQGQPEKAADIYRKLSLLNPSKSSYFAVLIEKLKSS